MYEPTLQPVHQIPAHWFTHSIVCCCCCCGITKAFEWEWHWNWMDSMLLMRIQMGIQLPLWAENNACSGGCGGGKWNSSWPGGIAGQCNFFYYYWSTQNRTNLSTTHSWVNSIETTTNDFDDEEQSSIDQPTTLLLPRLEVVWGQAA